MAKRQNIHFDEDGARDRIKMSLYGQRQDREYETDEIQPEETDAWYIALPGSN